MTLMTALAANQGADAATIAVCEPLKEGDHHLSVLITRNYKQAATLALDHFNASHPETKGIHRIKWCLEVEDPRRLLEAAITPDVTAMVGFAFTGESKIASQFAETHRFTYLSPAAALDELFDDGFARSLGMPMSKTAAMASTWLTQRFPTRAVHVFYANDVAYARLQAQGLKARLTGTLEHAYMQADEAALSLDGLKNKEPPVIVLAGYAHHHFLTLKRIVKAFPDAVFVTTNQWAYAQDFLRTVLNDAPNVQLYAVSDFADLTAGLGTLDVPPTLREQIDVSATRAKRFNADYQARFRREPEGFPHAVYDAVYLALSTAPRGVGVRVGASAVRGESERARAEQVARLRDAGWSAGVTGPIRIEKGAFSKPGYILKWDGKGFKPVEMVP